MTTKRKTTKRQKPGGDSAEQRVAMRVLARLPAIIAEILFALGRKKTTAPHPKPPAWVVAAVRLVCAKRAPLQHVQDLNKPGKNWTPANLGLADGNILSGLLMLANGTPKMIEEEAANPRLKHYRELFAETALASIRDQIKKAKPRKGDALPTIKSPRQLKEYADGQSLGTVSMFDQMGELDEPAATFQICAVLWIFWPDVRPDMTIREMYLWLQDHPLPAFSQKLLEKVCRKIGLKFGPRGRRAKKILLRQKTA